MLANTQTAAMLLPGSALGTTARSAVLLIVTRQPSVWAVARTG